MPVCVVDAAHFSSPVSDILLSSFHWRRAYASATSIRLLCLIVMVTWRIDELSDYVFAAYAGSALLPGVSSIGRFTNEV